MITLIIPSKLETEFTNCLGSIVYQRKGSKKEHKITFYTNMKYKYFVNGNQKSVAVCPETVFNTIYQQAFKLDWVGSHPESKQKWK